LKQLARACLYLILEWRLRGRAFVGSDQFVYWDPTDPRSCLAPDVFVRLGGPDELLRSFKTWEHGAPHVAVEIASEPDQRDRNLEEQLERYRRSGIPEVVRFEPESASTPLRIWDAVGGDLVERDLAAAESRRSDTLGAYWVLAPDPELGSVLRLSEDAEGRECWPTPEDSARAERAEKEAALRRIAELEAELARRR
jgi:Uma2 family endonuclease